MSSVAEDVSIHSDCVSCWRNLREGSGTHGDRIAGWLIAGSIEMPLKQRDKNKVDHTIYLLLR